MTDDEVIRDVLSCIDPSSGGLRIVRRNGRALLALPGDAQAASRALALYQPQRGAARMMARALRLSISLGTGVPFSRRVTPVAGSDHGISDQIAAIPGTCGLLLGSPEHRTRRVIASYRNDGGWEVAKIFFGPEDGAILEHEAAVLASLANSGTGAPSLLGIHHSARMTILRMPYLQGAPLEPGESSAATDLLIRWITNAATRPMDTFPEWESIRRALAAFPSGTEALRLLSQFTLRPVVRHGDFARWNLRKKNDGSLIVLDWEWGHPEGMPGIDLAHYFLQDARLVSRMAPDAAIRSTIAALAAPDRAGYLEKTGWGKNPIPAIVACLAYKQGADHQENRDALAAALELMC